MAKLIVALVLLLLLAGGTIGGMYMGKIGPFAEPPPEVENKPPPEPAPDLTVANSFLDAAPLMIPLFEDDRVVKQMTIMVQLEIPPQHVAYVSTNMPRLMNTLTIELYDWLPRHLATRPMADLGMLKSKMLQLSKKTLGEDKVADVLIKSAYQRQ